MPKVLAILAEGFEEIEAVTPIDLLRRAGVEVTVASLAPGIHVTGRSGITLHADTPLAAVEAADFDGVLLPGGAGVKHLRADPRVTAVVKRHAAAGRWVAAICAAPLVLHDAGLLAGRRYTAHPSTAAELPAALAGEPVVEDGRLITSRGAGTSVEFALRLVARLVSTAKADEVAASVCAPPQLPG
jgi:4-methyl-5(b-hydroxyethyl)-thiazole monophosphate biosynthesis